MRSQPWGHRRIVFDRIVCWILAAFVFTACAANLVAAARLIFRLKLLETTAGAVFIVTAGFAVDGMVVALGILAWGEIMARQRQMENTLLELLERRHRDGKPEVPEPIGGRAPP